jgi:hypothetical protein
MDTSDAFAQAPAVLAIDGRRFVVLPPRPRDVLAVNARMKELARAKCTSPIDYVLAHAHVAPGALELLCRQAILLGSGNGVRPDESAIWDEFASLDGVRWRVWYFASKVEKSLKLEDVAALVTEDNLFDVAADLDAALRLASIDPKKETPAASSTGAPS